MGLLELQRNARRFRLSLDQIQEFHKNLKIETWPEQNQAGLENISMYMEEFVFNDPVQKMLKTFLSTQQRRIMPLPPHFRFLQDNPIMCGLMNVHLHLSVQEAGIMFANAWGSVMFLCHLYNALQKEGLLQCRWPDLDMIISNHSATHVFVGDRPTDISSCYMHFCLAIVAGRFDSVVEEGMAEMSCMLATRPLTSVSTSDAQEQGETLQQTLRQRFKTRKVLSPVELVETLFDAVSYELPMLKLDYFSLHRRCWMFLRSLNESLRPQFHAAFGQGYLEQEQQLPFLVGYILQIASGSKQAFSKIRLPAGHVASSRVMTTAGVALSGFYRVGWVA